MKNICVKSCILLLFVGISDYGITQQIAIESKVSDDSQVTSNYTPKQRLWIDYEVKDNPNPTDGLLDSIALAQIEVYRDVNLTIEVLDPNTGNIIILYSVIDAMINESESKYFIDFIKKLYFLE